MEKKTKLIGALIVQDSFPDILRCLESLVCCEEIYVCDGGSKDGSREWLEKVKDIYHLHIFDRKYDEQGAQRNFLLSKIPKNVWLCFIDQDEKLNNAIQKELPGFITQIHPNLYTDTKRQLPLTIHVPNLNLVRDIRHFDASHISFFASKIFYNDRDLHFSNGYHCTVMYGENEVENTNVISPPVSWAIIHYAHLDQQRVANVQKDNASGKRRYDLEEWDDSKKDIQPIPNWWLL